MNPIDLRKEIEKAKVVGLNRWLLDALVVAFEDARKNKLKTHDEHKFEANWMRNIVRLRDTILAESYRPGGSVAFVVSKPKVREIFAAPFRDRVVHHFLFDMQAGWWDRRFIQDSYSCRKGKGTLYGIKRAQGKMRAVTNNFTEDAYVFKFDIKGYFMSLSREKLYERVKWGLDRQFEKYMNDPIGYQIYKICDFCWRQIIFDDPAKKAHRRGPKYHWDPSYLPPEKSLFAQLFGIGIVIGNLTSQLMSNIFMDQLDRFIKYELGYKYYGRYVDDFFIMVPKSEVWRVKRDIPRIESFLKDELGLEMHKKKRYIQSVYKGMEFLGARIYPRVLYPSDRLQANFTRALQDVAYGHKDPQDLVSYLGIMKHLNAKDFVSEKFRKMGWD